MSQYQSFPGAPGDSRTLDKLKTLKLPDPAGRTFLDVGCNEGFFCGFAKYLGASRSVGVDYSALFIERARKRFPDCEFLQQGWDTLPEGRFDTILLASALHYAEDQEALVHALVDKLTDDGVLVLELGIVSSQVNEWVKVKRGIDERWFPTMPKLREVLKDYAWKWMGPSVDQDGDPVKRHVLHVCRRRPVAYLLMEAPGYGKTSIARRLFARAKIPHVSGDQTLSKVASGKLPASDALKAELADGFSPFMLDRILHRIFDKGLGPDLVALWLAQAGAGSFALDVYVPEPYHPVVDEALVKAGYLPVHLRWNRVGPRLLGAAELEERGEAFYLAMVGETPAAAASRNIEPTGFVDELTLGHGRLTVRGWAVDRQARLPRQLLATIGGRDVLLEGFEKQLRGDVQQHLDLPHALFGFRARIDVEPGLKLPDLAGTFQLRAAENGAPLGSPFQLSGQLAKRLAR